MKYRSLKKSGLLHNSVIGKRTRKKRGFGGLKTMRLRRGGRRSVNMTRKKSMTTKKEKEVIFSGGDLVSILPGKYFGDSERTMKFGEEKFHVPYYKTVGCVNDMCSATELTQACLNSLGIAMIEHQSYDDYESVLNLYKRLTPEQRDDIIESNLISLRTYIADIFINYNSDQGLGSDKQEELRRMLSVINPFYYHYLINTDSLPDKIRDVVYKEMNVVSKIEGPLGLVRLFLSFYNTLNPYSSTYDLRVSGKSYKELSDADRKGYLSRYLRNGFRIESVMPSSHSDIRYKEDMNWDMEGKLIPETIPQEVVVDNDTLLKTIDETYGDSFARPNMIVLKGCDGRMMPLDIELTRRDMDMYPNVDEYAYVMQVEMMKCLLGMSDEETKLVVRKMLPDRGHIRERTEGIEGAVSEKETVSVDVLFGDKLSLVGKIYVGVLGTSIYYRFVDEMQIGDIGIINKEDAVNREQLLNRSGREFGILADFLTLGKDDCNMIYLNGSHGNVEVSKGVGLSIRDYLLEKAPEYVDKYPDLYEDAKEGKLSELISGSVPSYREIDLSNGTALTVNIYRADLLLTDTETPGFFMLSTIVEVNRYKNVDNSDNPLLLTTDFMIVWENKKEDERSEFSSICGGLDKMLMSNIWKDMNGDNEIPKEVSVRVFAELPKIKKGDDDLLSSMKVPEKDVDGVLESKGDNEEVESAVTEDVTDGAVDVMSQSKYTVEDGVEEVKGDVSEDVSKGIGDVLDDITLYEKSVDDDEGKDEEEVETTYVRERYPEPSKGILKAPSGKLSTKDKYTRKAKAFLPKKFTRKVRIKEEPEYQGSVSL